MSRLSDNYYQRKCYFKQEQVPTQSVMKEKMSPPLAKVYFKSMKPSLKILAGLEPPMKGGGSDWFVPPIELLDHRRAVLKPIKREFLSKLGFMGVDFFGDRLVARYHKSMHDEKEKTLLENDNKWKQTISATCQQHFDDLSKQAATENTRKILCAFEQFSTEYICSINKVEELLFQAAIDEVKRVREETFNKMAQRLQMLVKQQAIELYEKYTKKLNKEKDRLKAEFINNLERSRTEMVQKYHDINVEKHMAIEKLRYFLECQNLACRVYVALKEREECKKEIDVSKHEHEKVIKNLKEEIDMKNFEISLEREKERKRQAFNKIWQKKICEVVKKFQMFVSYCLKALPDHLEFFLNMEKLMMLQFNEAVENPEAESIFDIEQDTFHTPIPKPHPFFLFCDKGYRPNIDPDLCPKHCTSSASQLPVIVANKRYIYAACDNFKVITDKIKEYMRGRCGDDADFIDDHDYTYDIPVKVTSSHQIEELKMESSLLQVLQKERPNLKGVTTACCVCKVPHCFCSKLEAVEMPATSVLEVEKKPSVHSIPSGNKINERSVELEHERQPKWESYIDYVKSKKCRCPRTAKKNLGAHLPAYMKNMSAFDAPDLPNYEPCSLIELKELVRKAQRKRPRVEAVVVESKTRDAGTQYSDQAFENICTCLSEDEIERFLREICKQSRPGELQLIDGSITESHLQEDSSSFATGRAISLRNLLADAPELEEIFRKSDCKFD